MAAWCGSRTKDEVLAALDEARIPAAPLYSPQQALDDEHIKQMGYYQPIDYPGLPAPAPVMETPFRLSATPGSIRSRPPTIGEHTDEILGSLGYDAASIAKLRAGQVV